jgi:hypothetical protein
MSQAAMAEMPSTAISEQYPALPVNGKTVQTGKDMVLEFTDSEDRVVQVLVEPRPVGIKVPTGFFRSPGGQDELYHIVPALALWTNGVLSKKVIAIGYSDHLRKWLPLFKAVDTLRDEKGHHEKVRESPMLYRAVDPDTGKTAKSQSVVSIVVTDLEEIGKTV